MNIINFEGLGIYLKIKNVAIHIFGVKVYWYGIIIISAIIIALFLSKRRERISNRTVQYIVKRELQKAGLDITKYSVHKLRHTAATLMYQYGNIDIRALQELLGHKSISTTEIYTHVDNSQVRNAVESNPLANL